MTTAYVWTREHDKRNRIQIHNKGACTPFLAHVSAQLEIGKIQRWLDGFTVHSLNVSDESELFVRSKSQVNHAYFTLEPQPDGILISCRTVRLTRKLKSRRWEEKGSVSVSYAHNLPKQMNILQRSLWSRYAKSS